MTNTDYGLKPGYYWKITPIDHLDHAAVLILKQITTPWTVDLGVAGHLLEDSPEDYEASLKKAMDKVKSNYPEVFADYTEDVIKYGKALKNITSSVAN